MTGNEIGVINARLDAMEKRLNWIIGLAATMVCAGIGALVMAGQYMERVDNATTQLGDVGREVSKLTGTVQEVQLEVATVRAYTTPTLSLRGGTDQ